MTAARQGALSNLTPHARSALIRLLRQGPASRADLARHLRLSAATLTRTARTLQDDSFLVDVGEPSEQRIGRPSQLMDVNVDRAHLIGINLSNNAMNTVRTDLRGTVLAQTTQELTSDDPGHVVDALVAAIAAQGAEDDTVAAVGVSLAGPVSPRKPTVEVSPFLGWRDLPLAQLIQERTGLFAVVENDVRALTAVEHWFGAAAHLSDFALVTVGTGVGCGLVLDDQLIDTASGGVGQIGHLRVTDSGPLCERGHRGCVRSYLASPLILEQARTMMRHPDLTWDELLDAVRTDDHVARRLTSDAARALGTVVGTVAALTAPSKILISGEGVGLVPLVIDEVRAAAAQVQHWTVPEVPIEVVPFTFTEWARGAAVIALRHTLDQSVRDDD